MGYSQSNGNYADTDEVVVLGKQTVTAQTIGAAIEVGERAVLRLALEVFAKSGTNPTLDVTIQTSKDGSKGWRTLESAFAQKTAVGLAMGAVTAAGTTPPTITLTGTPLVPVDLRVECTTLGARGTSVIRYSIDGGVTWTSGVTTAATVDVGTTGVVLNIATGNAAVDNVWTAKTAGYEQKQFAGCDRFIRAVCQTGGTNPSFELSVTGEAA